MKFEGTKVFGFENAIIGMRLPMNKNYEDAKGKSDSKHSRPEFDPDCFFVGNNDADLMQRLINADNCTSGQPNSKFMRMIHVQVAITAPMYWWSQADTYKVGTASNSTSKMHKLTAYPITQECFEKPILNSLLAQLEAWRVEFVETKNKDTWEQLMNNLPISWLQTRMFDCNYQVLRNMYKQRRNHKLEQWHKFCEWVSYLPYADKLLIS